MKLAAILLAVLAILIVAAEIRDVYRINKWIDEWRKPWWREK